VLVSAHYDSISQLPERKAPGAVDNASGCGGVCEIARAFAQNPQFLVNYGMMFVLFDGEEWNLDGSTALANEMEVDGRISKIKFHIQMDMFVYFECFLGADVSFRIGFNAAFLKNGGWLKMNVECFSDQIHSLFRKVKKEYSRLFSDVEIVELKDVWGSDHVPFSKRGVKSVLMESDFHHHYPYYHKMDDTFENCNEQVATRVIKLGIAVLATFLQQTNSKALTGE